MPDITLETMVKEMTEMKKKWRRQRWLSLWCHGLWATALVITFLRKDFHHLRTEQLEIVNAAGRVVLELSQTPSGSGTLLTYDGAGRVLLELAKTESAGSLRTFHRDGAVLFELGNSPGGGSFSTYSNHGRPLLRASKTGYGGDLSLYSSENDGQRVSAALSTLGGGGVQHLSRWGGNIQP